MRSCFQVCLRQRKRARKIKQAIIYVASAVKCCGETCPERLIPQQRDTCWLQLRLSSSRLGVLERSRNGLGVLGLWPICRSVRANLSIPRQADSTGAGGNACVRTERNVPNICGRENGHLGRTRGFCGGRAHCQVIKGRRCLRGGAALGACEDVESTPSDEPRVHAGVRLAF